jgi:cytochrome P450
MSAFEYDPTRLEFQLDPFPVFKTLRDEHPAYYNEWLRFWVLTRWDDVWNAASDHETFASNPAHYGERDDEPTELMPRWMMDFGIFYLDPPRHDRMRSLLARTFTPRRVEALTPIVRRLARELLGRIAGAGHCELMRDYAAPLATQVIGALLGVPEADRWQFRLWAEKIEQREPSVAVAVAEREQREAVDAIHAYLTELVAKQRAQPGDGLLAALLQAEIDGDRLTDEEVVGMGYQLMVAGNDTTASLIANGAVRLAEHPDQRSLLVGDPSGIRDAVEEMARYDAPTVQSPPRITTRPVELHGREIPKGSPVVLAWMGANHNERQFPDADRFDVRRRMKRHLGFGHGLHFCVGASLARVEARIAFEELLRFAPDYQLDGRPERWASTWLRVLGSVPIAFDVSS